MCLMSSQFKVVTGVRYELLNSSIESFILILGAYFEIIEYPFNPKTIKAIPTNESAIKAIKIIGLILFRS